MTHNILYLNILIIGIFDIFNGDYGNALTAFYLLYKLPKKILSDTKKDLLSKKFIYAYTLWNTQFIINTSSYGSELFNFQFINTIVFNLL